LFHAGRRFFRDLHLGRESLQRPSVPEIAPINARKERGWLKGRLRLDGAASLRIARAAPVELRADGK
jgi:hypothetical protein